MNDIVSSSSYSCTPDSPDIAYQLSCLNTNLNIIVYFISVIFGLSIALIMCLIIYKLFIICTD